MAGGGAAAAAAIEHAIKEMTKSVVEVINSSHFDRGNITERKLKLSQAYCLLWQDLESGEVSGRMSSPELNAGCAGAALLDLIALGVIDVDVVAKKTLGISYKDNYVRVVRDSPTGTYLDKAVFDKILKRHQKKPNDPREVSDWIRDDVHTFSSSKTCSGVTFESLVDLGILDEKKKFIGKKFPTLNAAPETELVDQIRKIALENAEPDSYMQSLLTLMRAADDLHCFMDPLLKRHFSSEEYDKAKKRIKALVGLGKKGPENYEAM